jgi:hypothetical protein
MVRHLLTLDIYPELMMSQEDDLPEYLIPDWPASRRIYAEFKAEQEREVVRETEEVEKEVLVYEVQQIVARELTEVVSILRQSI